MNRFWDIRIGKYLVVGRFFLVVGLVCNSVDLIRRLCFTQDKK